MKWEGNRESDNVEDRREGGGGGGFQVPGGRGIGIGTIVKSWMLLRRPMRMRLTSPRTTTFIQIDDSSPRNTSPITCALWSTYALGSIDGTMSLKGRITALDSRQGDAAL